MMPRGVGKRSIGSWIRFVWLNAWFWTVAPLVSVIFVSLAAIYVGVFLVLLRNRRKTQWLIRRSMGVYARLMIICAWPLVRVKYVDYAPQETPPFLFICNHRSFSDAYLTAYVGCECIQVLNIWPAHVPLMGQLARLAGFLRVREMPFEEFIAAGSKLLQEGCSIIAFPEGTRSGSVALGSFHGSSFRLAQLNCVKIVPFVISGNENIPRRGSAWLNPGVVSVSKLPALTPEMYEGMSPYKLKTLVRDMIARHLDGQKS
jgi:1-acyl-sn-glycerol-3-phosphate acyltransferase